MRAFMWIALIMFTLFVGGCGLFAVYGGVLDIIQGSTDIAFNLFLIVLGLVPVSICAIGFWRMLRPNPDQPDDAD